MTEDRALLSLAAEEAAEEAAEAVASPPLESSKYGEMFGKILEEYHGNLVMAVVTWAKSISSYMVV